VVYQLGKVWETKLRQKGKKVFHFKLYLKDADLTREIIANDDYVRQQEIFKSLHLPDHTGMKAMYENSKKLYAGFKREKLNLFVSSCIICKRHVPLPRIAPIMPIVADYPWQLVQMDCIDMRNYADVNDDFGWILNILDSYSKFLFSFPLKQKTAENVKAALEQVIFLEGAPRIVQTDNGREFVNVCLRIFLKDKNIQHVRGRPRHPKNQGQVERVNQTLTRKLAKALSIQTVKRWINVHREVVFKYNTTWHRANNTTPMQVFRGRTGVNDRIEIDQKTDAEIMNPSIEDDQELIADLGNILEEEDTKIIPNVNVQSQQRINAAYRRKYVRRMVNDADVHYNSINFNPGDRVLVKKSFDTNQKTKKEKMDDFYEDGFWHIVERISEDSFRVKHDSNARNTMFVSKNRLKKCDNISTND
jgi:Integrase core domain